MSAMFPESGVPWTDARNSLSNPDTQDCDELWYSTSRCQPRFDPAAANAMLAEQVNLINEGEVTYDCDHLDQVQRAIRYLIQRGLPCGAQATGTPNDYVVTLDPPLTRYNDFLSLIVVPEQTNNDKVTLNCNYLGSRPLVRNDGLEFRMGDFKTGTPYPVGYWNGKFWLLEMAASQVFVPTFSDIDGWIRPDGNDITGDGTANTADKAFRTIGGAFMRMATAFLPSTVYRLNLRLGIPGDYEPGPVGPYGGNIGIVGDIANPAGYRIKMGPYGQWDGVGLVCNGIGNLRIEGVTFLFDTSSRPGNTEPWCLTCGHGTYCVLYQVRFQGVTSNGYGGLIDILWNSTVSWQGTLTFAGNGISVRQAISVVGQSSFFAAMGPANGQMPNASMSSINNSAAFICVGSLSWGSLWGISHYSIIGYQYQVADLSLLRVSGGMPGSIYGYTMTGGIFVAS